VVLTMSSPALDGNAVAITVQAIPGAACSGPAPGAFKPNTSRQINPESQTIGDKEKCHMIRSLHPGCERCHMADQRDMLIERAECVGNFEYPSAGRDNFGIKNYAMSLIMIKEPRCIGTFQQRPWTN
jgi:hypothetical protein